MFEDNLETDTKILSKYTKYLTSQDPLLGDIPSYKKLHSGGIIYKSNEKKLEVPLSMLSSQISHTFEDIYHFKLEKICIEIYECAEQFHNEFKKIFFTTISQITDFTGNVVDGKGKGINGELILDVLDKTHIEFDRDGNPILPTMVVHPDMAKSVEKLKSQESLYKKRFEEIISKKREEYYAEKGRRGLSRID